MAGMFDQLEQAAHNVKKTSTLNPGFIDLKLEPDFPIFSKTKMNFLPSDKITHVAISNKFLVIVMANQMLFRMNIQQPDQHDEISLSKFIGTSRLAHLFLDPTGNHLLISILSRPSDASPAQLIYLARKSTKLKATYKFKGLEVTEVGWNTSNESDISTGSILVGTSKGLIIETELVTDGDKFFTSSTLEQYWKQVFDIGKGTNTPITGIRFGKIPNTEEYFIFVATPNRLYYFIGRTNLDEKPFLQQVFNRYLNIPEEETFTEAKSSLYYSRLKFWSESLGYPKAYVWLLEKGIAYGEINPALQKDIKAIKAASQLILYPKPMYEEPSVLQKPPFACVLTEFHVLLAYIDTIKGMSVLNKEVVYEDNYNEAFGKLINIIKDPVTDTIWAVTENSVFRFKVTKEERNVWQIYSENKQFDLAKQYARNNPIHLNHVLIKEADMLFDEGKYFLSAQRYAEAQSSFEEVALKFIHNNKQDALKTFLSKKLETLTTQDKTQVTVIVIWLVELYLNELENMRINEKEQSVKYYELQREFQTFLALSQVSECIKHNKTTIYDLMASHGDKNNMIQLTIVHKNFEQLIRQHIYKNSFLDALDVLKSQNNRELFYQFAPILIQEIPKYTVKALIEQGANLVPIKLLPALVSVDGEMHSKEVIKYLEFAVDIRKNTEKAIHNLLVSLYAKYEPEKLMAYLDRQGQDITMVNYNVHFALRLCQERDLTQACVQLSALLGLWESAVDLALTINVELAKQYANMPPQNDFELKRKLWLKIAQHIVSGKENIEQAMEFLKHCDLLRIEDILPFFSDFVVIDHFKDAICNSLKEYNHHIQDLKDEMEEATQSADRVRQEIQTFRNRFTFISTGDVCEICDLTLVIRQFYLFPCNHKFHSDCLFKELSPILGPAKKNRLADLQRQQKILHSQINSDTISNTSSGITVKETVKTDIDNIIASECLYCGENMIRNIDMPFIDEKEYNYIMKEWE